MENVADALKMAGAVLIFVLAVSVTIVFFGQVRETSDIILNYRDRETSYQYYEIQGNDDSIRTVGIESVIPAIFRAYLENYLIAIDFGDNEPIYQIRNSDGSIEKKYVIDLSGETIAANAKVKFLRGLLYHDFNYPGISGISANREQFRKEFGAILPDEKLYDKMLRKINEGYVIKEYLGVFYEDDSPNTPDVNKMEKRIITYQFVQR